MFQKCMVFLGWILSIIRKMMATIENPKANLIMEIQDYDHMVWHTNCT